MKWSLLRYYLCTCLFVYFNVSSFAQTGTSDVLVPLKDENGKIVIDEKAFTSKEPLARFIGNYCTALLNNDRRLWASLMSKKEDLVGSIIIVEPLSEKRIWDAFEDKRKTLSAEIRGARVRGILISQPLWSENLTYRACVSFRFLAERDGRKKTEELEGELPSVIKGKKRLSIPIL